MGGQKSVAIACVFTYHLPLRVLLLPEGGDLRYYRLFSQQKKNPILKTTLGTKMG